MDDYPIRLIESLSISLSYHRSAEYISSRLHTEHEYDQLKQMYEELEEELRRERTSVIELQNRLADIDGHSLYSR